MMTNVAQLERGAATFELETSPSHLIHRAQQFATDRYAEALKAAGITQRQFAVLTAVQANEGLSQTDLVQSTGIDRSTLAELVARMTERRLLARARAKDDARAKTVSLTAEGRRVLARTRPLAAAADAAIMRALPKSKRAAFVETLQRFARSVDEVEAPPSRTKAKAKPRPKAKAKHAKAPAKAKAKAKPATRAKTKTAAKAKAKPAAKAKAKTATKGKVKVKAKPAAKAKTKAKAGGKKGGKGGKKK